jgi:hypothetical protein
MNPGIALSHLESWREVLFMQAFFKYKMEFLPGAG